MLVPTRQLVESARREGYALGAFNVYNLEGVRAVVAAAETAGHPFMLQVHPAALTFGGAPLLALCRAAVAEASVPGAVHLDHSSSAAAIIQALDAGASSVMADGSQLPYDENVRFTRAMAQQAHQRGCAIEGELGRLSGEEDGSSVAEREAQLTDPHQAAQFVHATGVDLLAVCIGNVHGAHTRPPVLDFERLAQIRAQVNAPLVLHGASGLPADQIRQAIAHGVVKFNVNTEVRMAALAALRAQADDPGADLLDLMQAARVAMEVVVAEKLRLFSP